MIFIEDSSRTLAAALKDYSQKERKVPLDIQFSDFDGTQCHLSEVNDEFRISISSVSVRAVLAKFNLQESLKDFLQISLLQIASNTESGFDITFTGHKNKLGEPSIESISQLRSEILAIPLKSAFSSADQSFDGKQMTIPLNKNESIYILPYSDRIMVTYSMLFEDDSDAVLSKVFLQELFDTRQKHTVQNAPTVIFGKDLPSEMAPYVSEETKNKCSFISFVFLPCHFAAEKRDKTASLILNFRTYLHYHLKTTKAYLHNRMRGKVADFLKVLNRAKLENNA